MLGGAFNNIVFAALSGTVGWLPSQEATIRAWYRSDQGVVRDGSNNVDSWLDYSGQGNHLSGSGGTRPVWTASDAALNNRPSIVFDGIDDFLNRATFVGGAIAQPYTVYWIGTAAVVGSTQQLLNDGSTANNCDMYRISTGAARMFANGAGSLTVGTLGSETRMIYRGLFTTTSAGRIIRDGVADASASGAIGTAALNGLTLAAVAGGGASEADCAIAEVMVFAGDFTGSENTDLIPYAEALYNITPA